MRSTSVVFLLISTLFVKFARAQESNELIIRGQTGNLYLLHTVAVKETWYSIRRLYNISPKAIAPFNTLSMAKPLSIGQQIEIPLTAVNFSQTGLKAAAGETLIPVYHIVQEKEWMYRVSVNHNKVPIGSLEKWNHITKDDVKAGMSLVVGFLKVKTALSALAKQRVTPAGTVATGLNPVSPGATVSTGTAPTGNAKIGNTATKNAATGNVSTTFNTKSDTSPMTMKQPPAVKKIPPGELPGTVLTRTETAKIEAPAAKTFNGGYFRSDFTETGKSASGLSGIFKSSSGWQDGKYYALMNNVGVGTIVRITLTSANKTVYAKILGQLPEMKESAGLTIRISNAAAAELGAGDGRTPVEITY